MLQQARASDRPEADLKPGSQFQLLGGWRCSKIAPGHAIRGWWVPLESLT
jgi:hypothetical protein